MLLSGESPSSSASDVDNLNNQGTVDKVALAKCVGSPHVAGNHVIAARHRPNFVRVLSFVSIHTPTNSVLCLCNQDNRVSLGGDT